MPEPTPITSVNEGLWRFGGMYGAAYRDNQLLAEAVEVTGAVEINRLEVPLAGQTRQGYKAGRETREGTLRIQKIDSKWELEVYKFLSQGLEERREARDRNEPTLRPFNLILEFDDPDALGVEKWQLEGCLIWRMQLGFSIGDDLVEREFPLTWEKERPLKAFVATAQEGGAPVVNYEYDTANTQ